MFSIISPLKIIVLACQIYATFTLSTVVMMLLINPELSASTALKVVLGGAGILELSLLIIVHIFWRKLWAKYPALNELLFPDLNGDWKMDISWTSEGKNGTVAATATIKQSLLSVSMEVRSSGSDSETIVVKTSKDSASGRPQIYYFYRVIPKYVDTHSSDPYEGASTLKLFTEEGGVLRGNYFTSRNTKGHFKLTRE